MKKKALFFCLIAMVVLIGACGGNSTGAKGANDVPTSEPKDAVGYVQVSPPDDLRTFLLRVAMSPKVDESMREGFIAYYTAGHFGSGFVVAGGNGHTRLVTNRHVAEGGDRVDVSFDGNKSTIRGEIVHIDNDYDLAVIELPIARRGLELKLDVADQESVRSVGYPGIPYNGRNHGSYQIAKGTVTNACLKGAGRITAGNKSGCWIQHSAPIDGGSSGGPLLSDDNRVLGLTTRHLRGRNLFFMAVPATHVAKAIKRADEILAKRNDKTWMTAQLQKACYSFASELSTKNTNLERLVTAVSYKLVVEKGLEAFDEMSDSAEAKALKELAEEDALEAIQLSIVSKMREQFVELGGLKPGERCSSINPNDDVLSGEDVRIDVEMRDGNGHMELLFHFERGQWRLSGY